VLGLAFSWGALMGFAGILGRIDLTALVLYAGSIAWVIGYDTIYAHQDAEDDALIGVKSTARLFGAATHRALVGSAGRLCVRPQRPARHHAACGHAGVEIPVGVRTLRIL